MANCEHYFHINSWSLSFTALDEWWAFVQIFLYHPLAHTLHLMHRIIAKNLLHPLIVSGATCASSRYSATQIQNWMRIIDNEWAGTMFTGFSPQLDVSGAAFLARSELVIAMSKAISGQCWCIYSTHTHAYWHQSVRTDSEIKNGIFTMNQQFDAFPSFGRSLIILSIVCWPHKTASAARVTMRRSLLRKIEIDYNWN